MINETHPLASSQSISALQKRFFPVVKKQLFLGATDDFDNVFKWDIVFVKEMQRVNGVLMHLTAEPVRTLTMQEMIDFASRFDYFSNCEAKAYMQHHGYAFSLGDGDDSSAVTFEGGKFKIWLRGWK